MADHDPAADGGRGDDPAADQPQDTATDQPQDPEDRPGSQSDTGGQAAPDRGSTEQEPQSEADQKPQSDADQEHHPEADRSEADEGGPDPDPASEAGDTDGHHPETGAGTGEQGATATDDDSPDASADRIADLEAELAALRELVDRSRDRIDDLETQLADYQRRNDREHEELRKYAVEDLAAEMLKVRDTLVDAIEMEDLEADTEQRLRMVGKQFDKVLTSGRIDRIEPDEQEPYDDELHRMVDKVATDEYEPGHVVRVQEIGYRIHDRVIRPARVVVAESERQ